MPSEQNPQASFQTNVMGIQNILEGARLFNVRQVIYAGTKPLKISTTYSAEVASPANAGSSVGGSLPGKRNVLPLGADCGAAAAVGLAAGVPEPVVAVWVEKQLF